MGISEVEFNKEKKVLNLVNKLVDETINDLSKDVKATDSHLLEFKKMMWENESSFDDEERAQVVNVTSGEEVKALKKQEYFNRLLRIKEKPYFASIVFKDEDGELINIYLSLTYLKDKKSNYILYDWRSPICSLFYDYELGKCSYSAPGGIYSGELKRKRQYKIEDRKLVGVFDNSLNISDEVLQEVLSEESSEKMKNVVNTIQQEQNQVIRNIEDDHLIVQGIAGSGKTTVALHRIAFLLYRIKDLRSDDIIIFSPNTIFTEYIQDVLPSLGEANTLQTTFADYLASFITEYKEVESFSDFISRYYQNRELNPELVEYKQSNKIVKDLLLFLKDYVKRCSFLESFIENEKNTVDKRELNEYLHYKYNKLPLMERVDEISMKLSSKFYKGSLKKAKTFHKLLMKHSNFNKKVKDVYKEFLESSYFNYNITDSEIKNIIESDTLPYEDALLFAYIKGYLEGFIYEGRIKQVVIDEAQDYNLLQYLIIREIFKKADFTILGDVNQNINPYYHYDTLEDLTHIFSRNVRYLELNKTYRSSPNIINFTNKILGLNHVNAIRKDNNKPVLVRKNYASLKEQLLKDIAYLTKQYKSLAIITKDDYIAKRLYNLISMDIDISLVEADSKSFHRELVIIPAYVSKGLEFDSVIVFNDLDNAYRRKERNLLYVACTRCQHELIIYN